jgi:hypothetical protein
MKTEASNEAVSSAFKAERIAFSRCAFSKNKVQVCISLSMRRPSSATSSSENTPVDGELIKSCGGWSLVQTSTVLTPSIRIETYGRHRSVNFRFWQASFQPRMRAMAVIVMLKAE